MNRPITNGEMPKEDRLALSQLIDQIKQVADGLENLNGGDRLIPELPSGESAFRFAGPNSRFQRGQAGGLKPITRSSRPPLPDPRLVRQIISQRHNREQYFDSDLFVDPAWDMLLDLTAARAEHVRVSVTSLCIASGVAPTTALRWMSRLVDAGLFKRIEDDTDHRRTFVDLTDKAAGAISRYFAQLGKGASELV